MFNSDKCLSCDLIKVQFKKATLYGYDSHYCKKPKSSTADCESLVTKLKMELPKDSHVVLSPETKSCQLQCESSKFIRHAYQCVKRCSKLTCLECLTEPTCAYDKIGSDTNLVSEQTSEGVCRHVDLTAQSKSQSYKWLFSS